MLKLNLLQNALHTLHHAVEHLQWSEEDIPSKNGRVFDIDDNSVTWRNQEGHQCFQISEFTRMPPAYNLKFSLLHLIQASELLLKAYVEKCEPTALFIARNSTRTISLQQALEFTRTRKPDLLSQHEIALLLEAKRLRNAIEHYRFEMAELQLRTTCVDFLAICTLLAQGLLSVNIIDVFSWDYLQDKPDRIADYIALILTHVTDTGRHSARKTGELWAACNSSEPVFLCLSCGTRTVSRDRGMCMGCGSEGDEEIVELLESFEKSLKDLARLQKSSAK